MATGMSASKWFKAFGSATFDTGLSQKPLSNDGKDVFMASRCAGTPSKLWKLVFCSQVSPNQISKQVFVSPIAVSKAGSIQILSTYFLLCLPFFDLSKIPLCKKNSLQEKL